MRAESKEDLEMYHEGAWGSFVYVVTEIVTICEKLTIEHWEVRCRI